MECMKEAKRGAQPTRGPFRREPSARSGGPYCELGIWTCVVVLSDVSG